MQGLSGGSAARDVLNSMNLEQLKQHLLVLQEDVSKLDASIADITSKLDPLVQEIVNKEDILEREEKQYRRSLQELEEQEMSLEKHYSAKRLELVQARQIMRKKIFETKLESPEGTNNQTLSEMALSYSSENLRRDHETYGTVSRRSVIRSSQKNEAKELNSGFDLSDWEVGPEELEYDRTPNGKLGSGAFGDVFRGRLRGKAVAIKKLAVQHYDEEVLASFKKEVILMTKLSHPNVLLFMGACMAPGNLAMVTELMPRGSVYNLIHSSKGVPSFHLRMLFAKDCAQGVNCLHSKNPSFLHLDLKTHNLLVDENWTVKVADFGLSQVKQANNSKGKSGSRILIYLHVNLEVGLPLTLVALYMSPEMLQGKEYDEKTDVYSFGVILWELLTLEEPFKDQFQTFDDIVNTVAKLGRRPKIPVGTSQRLADLITGCWNPTPANRPSFQEILKTNVFDEVVIETLIRESNSLGRELWKENFLEQESVSWREFLEAFLKKIEVPFPKDQNDIQIQCLESLLVKKDKNAKEMVGLEDFARMLEWLGPLEKGKAFLNKVETELRMKGFFGMIETPDAEKIINGKKKGTYLIRFSSRDPGCYALTVMSNSVVHYRISHKAGEKFGLGGKDFNSLDDLIKAFKKDLNLKTPQTGSKYEAMFLAADSKFAAHGYMAMEEDH